MAGKRKRKSYWRLILLTLVVGLLFILFRSISFTSFGSGRGRLNLVIDGGGPIIFLSLNQRDESAAAFLIPANTQIEVPYGFGYYQAGAIFNLGQIDKRGGILLSKGIQDFLGIPVDGWITEEISNSNPSINTQDCPERSRMDKFQMTNDKKGIVDLKERLFGFEAIKNYNKIGTNLSLFDRFRLFLLGRTIRQDKIDFIDLKATDCLSDFVLADGTKVLRGDTACLDFLVKKYLFEEKISQEGLSIKIVNTTGYAGLGAKAARIIENMGARVLRVESIAQGLYKTDILVSRKNLNTETLQRLRKILEAKVKDEEPNNFDIIIYLGKNYQI